VVRQCKRAANLSQFFSPQKLPLNAAGVHIHVEVVLHLLCQLSETQGWLQGLLNREEYQDWLAVDDRAA